MSDIEPGQTWLHKHPTGKRVRVTVVTDTRVGFTVHTGETKYLSTRRFRVLYRRVTKTRTPLQGSGYTPAQLLGASEDE